jgi:hypothetical protein
MILSGPIDAFFKAPDQEPTPTGDCVLYWLRRGIVRLCGPEGSATDDPGEAGLVATVLVLTGIDFLGRVHAGKSTSSEETFRGILVNRGATSSDDAEALYQLRCGLAHSFALSSNRRRDRRQFDFTLRGHGPLVEQDRASVGGCSHFVNFWELRATFERVLTDMREQCRGLAPELMNRVAQAGEEKILTL